MEIQLRPERKNEITLSDYVEKGDKTNQKVYPISLIPFDDPLQPFRRTPLAPNNIIIMISKVELKYNIL